MSYILLQKRPNYQQQQQQRYRSCQQNYLENFLENLNYQQKTFRRVSQEPKIEFNSKTNKDSFELFFGFPFDVSSQNLNIEIKDEEKILQINFQFKGSYQKYIKQVRYPEDVSIEGISAKFKQNSLHIVLPREEEKEVEIPVYIVKKEVRNSFEEEILKKLEEIEREEKKSKEPTKEEIQRKIEEFKNVFDIELSDEYLDLLQQVLKIQFDRENESTNDIEEKDIEKDEEKETIEVEFKQKEALNEYNEEETEIQEESILKEQEIVEEVEVESIENVEIPAEFEVQKVENNVIVESIYPKFDEDKYKVHYDVLKGLGFERKDLIEELMVKHDGNIQSIVKDYLERN